MITINLVPEACFVKSQLSRNIRHALQALALDEQRFPFQSRLWVKEEEGQELKQCLFKGSHGDIGGGILNSSLSNITLAWMISQLEAYVYFKRDRIYHFAGDWTLLPLILRDRPRNRPRLTERRQGFAVENSNTRFYRLAGSQVRQPGRGPAESNQTIHFSVQVLDNHGGDNRPRAPALDDIRVDDVKSIEHHILEEWMREERHGPIFETLRKLVQAAAESMMQSTERSGPHRSIEVKDQGEPSEVMDGEIEARLR